MEKQMTRTGKCIIQCIFSVLLLIVTTSASSQNSPLKPRIVVLTDISQDEPDDHQSLIRLLVHADMYEIEGIVLTTGWSQRHPKEDMDMAKGAIDAYEKDLPNLLKRSNQSGFAQDNERQEVGYWPSAQYLKDRTMFGSMVMGMEFIGADNNSEGSDLIIKLADEDDDRPIWVTFWGGGNTLAQAIWKVQQTRSESELKTFLHKVRAYAITDQDRPNKTSFETSSHAWMRREFSDDLLFIWENCAWWYQVGHGRDQWSEYETHIQQHGNLGNQYPKYHYGVEGDTPSFLHLMPNGLNNPDVPTQVGWGGYSEWGLGEDNNGYAYVNRAGDAHTICRKYAEYFYPATFNNFAARMDWAKEGKGNRNPIAIINGNEGIEILKKNPRQGTTITLDASRSYDPDGDKLTFKWWIQPETGTYTKEITLTHDNTSAVTIEVPAGSAGKTFHVICEITDNGVPNLTSYRRIIFEPQSEDITGDYPSVTDIDGNVYPTVIIGNQEWMAKNLRVTKYNNGDDIPTDLDNTAWSAHTSGAYATYPHGSIDGLDSDAEVVAAYGKLYNWFAVDDERGLCPAGWSVPSDDDWSTLVKYVADQGFPNSDLVNGASNALKSCRQENHPDGGDCDTSEHPRWNSDGTHSGFDGFGFSALPGGQRFPGGTYFLIGYSGTWWSSSESSSTHASYRVMGRSFGTVYGRSNFNKNFGLSVRCFREVDN